MSQYTIASILSYRYFDINTRPSISKIDGTFLKRASIFKGNFLFIFGYITRDSELNR